MTPSSSPAARQIRVFVVDDHALARAGVRAEIGSHVDVVGEAASVRTAIDGIVARHPPMWCCSTFDCPMVEVGRCSMQCCRGVPRRASSLCRSPTWLPMSSM